MLKKIDLNYICTVLFVAALPLDFAFLSRGSGYRRSATTVDSEVILSNLFEIIVWSILYIVLTFRFLINIKKISFFYNQNLIFLAALILLFLSLSVSLSIDIYFLRGLNFYSWCIFVIMFFSLISLASSKDWQVIFNRLYKILLFIIILNILYFVFFPGNSLSSTGRFQGFFSNSNAFSRVVALFFIINISNFKLKFFRISYSLNTFNIFLASMLIIGSGSATTIVATAIISFIFFLQYLRIKGTSLYFAFFILLTLGIYSLALILSSDSIFSVLGRDASFTGRDIAWGYAIEYISSFNMFGYGLSDTRYVFYNAYISSTNMHSNFLEFYFRTGALGLVVHIVFILMAGFKLFSPRKNVVMSYIFILLFVAGLFNSIAFAIRGIDGLFYWMSLFYLASNTSEKSFSQTKG